MKILVTGCYGFIGSHFTKMAFDRLKLGKHEKLTVIGLDSMTYAARPEYLLNYFDGKGITTKQFIHEKVDIRKHKDVEEVFERHKPDHVIHFAAESHVCRSIDGPREFVRTNVTGTFNLLEAARVQWEGVYDKHTFHHVSTDEVFGQLAAGDKSFDENHAIKPRSPYAASKAASDLLALSYHQTYGMDVRVSNCSNNFGPNQHEEKLVPKTILALMKGEHVTVYGKGDQVRDWLFVEDHCEAIFKIMEAGKPGERYCIGGDLELSNLEMIENIAYVMKKDIRLPCNVTIRYTNDRPTDDFRYAIDCSKLKDMGWKPNKDKFHERLAATIRHYISEQST